MQKYIHQFENHRIWAGSNSQVTRTVLWISKFRIWVFCFHMALTGLDKFENSHEFIIRRGPTRISGILEIFLAEKSKNIFLQKSLEFEYHHYLVSGVESLFYREKFHPFRKKLPYPPQQGYPPPQGAWLFNPYCF